MIEATADDQFDDMFEDIESSVETSSPEPVTASAPPSDDGLVITFGGESFSIPMTQDLR